MFNETADRWFDKIEENKIYVFANGQVKMANKKYTSIKNDFCLTLGNETEIEECGEDKNIQNNGFSFTKIKDLAQAVAGSSVDVIGIVFDIGPISALKLKSGESKER